MYNKTGSILQYLSFYLKKEDDPFNYGSRVTKSRNQIIFNPSTLFYRLHNTKC